MRVAGVAVTKCGVAVMAGTFFDDDEDDLVRGLLGFFVSQIETGTEGEGGNGTG